MEQAANKKIITFVALTFALSAPLYLMIAQSGAAHDYSSMLMWAPGVAALVTQLIFTRGISGLGWGLPRPVFLVVAFLLPILYSAVVYVPVWLSGLGPFAPMGFLTAMGGSLPFKLEGDAQQTVAGIAYVGTYGVLTTCWATLGEELGWRGLLVPALAERYPFAATALISGVIWAVWHYPVLLLSDYNNAGAPLWFGLVCFTVLVLAISFAFAWLRLKSGSLWVPVLLHASHNVFIQAVFSPLTEKTATTPYVIDEFGAGLVLAGVGVAYFFWRKRADLPGQPG